MKKLVKFGAIAVVVLGYIVSRMPPVADSTAPANMRLSDDVPGSDAAGCIGADLDICLSNLQRGFKVLPTENLAAMIGAKEANNSGTQDGDARQFLTFHGTLAGWKQTKTVNLEYNNAKIVTYIEISLPNDPIAAKSPADYARSGLYESVVLLLGNQCPQLSRSMVQDFFDKEVRPYIIEMSYSQKAVNIPFCGHKFSYQKFSGYDTEFSNTDNPHGAYDRASIAIE